MVEFRRATAADAQEFWGRPALLSFRGVCAVKDGAVIGIGGGYIFRGRLMIFSEMKPEMRKHLKARAKAVRIMLSFADSLGPTQYAVAQPDEPTSGRLLAKLGFKPTGEMTELGELLIRRVG